MAAYNRGKIVAGEEEEDDIPVKLPQPAITPSHQPALPARVVVAQPVPSNPAYGKVVSGEEEEDDSPIPSRSAKPDHQALETVNPFVFNPEDKEVISTPEKSAAASLPLVPADQAHTRPVPKRY